MSVQMCNSELDFAVHQEIIGLELHVQRRLNGRVRGFHLLVHADGLILRGAASTFHAKQLAQHAVMHASRRRILFNEIQVDA